MPAQPAIPSQPHTGPVCPPPTRAGTRAGVPLSVWPAIPPPARCPAGTQPPPCPRRFTPEAARQIITAFTRPGDLVVIPAAGTGALAAAAATAGRRVLGLAPTPPGARDLTARLDHDLDPAARPLAQIRCAGPQHLLHAACGAAGQAALVVTAACATPGCPPPGSDRPPGTDPDPSLLYAACERALRPGGLLAVITSAARQPGHPGELIAHARAAGLIYTQHIIAVHAAIHTSRLVISPAGTVTLRTGGAAAPAHLPIHSDLLLFAAPGGPRHD